MRLTSGYWLVALGLSAVVHAALLTRFADLDGDIMVEAGVGAEAAVWGMSAAAFANEVSASQSAVPATELPVGEATEVVAALAPEDNAPVVDATDTDTGYEPRDPAVAEASSVEPVRADEAVEVTATDPVPAETEPVPVVPGMVVEEASPSPVETEPVEAMDIETVEPIDVDVAAMAAVAPVAVAAVEAEALPPPPPARPDPPKPSTSTSRQKMAPPPRPAAASNAPSGRQAGNQGQVPDALGRQIRSDYSGRVLVHLERAKRYPRKAQSRGIAGATTVRFTLGSDGEVHGAAIVRSSGHDILDAEIRAMLRRANPFPAIPAEIGRQSMTFTVTVRFVPR